MSQANGNGIEPSRELTLRNGTHEPAVSAAPGDRFWGRSADIEALGDGPAPGTTGALEVLGAAPFPRSKFPFLGFLASIYDHVVTCMGDEQSSNRSENASSF